MVALSLSLVFQNCGQPDLIGEDEGRPRRWGNGFGGSDQSLVLAQSPDDRIELTSWLREWLFAGMSDTAWQSSQFVITEYAGERQIVRLEKQEARNSQSSVVASVSQNSQNSQAFDRLFVSPRSIGRTALTLARTKATNLLVTRRLEIFVVPRAENEVSNVVLSGPRYVVEGAQAVFSVQAAAGSSVREYRGFLGADWQEVADGPGVFGAFDDTCCESDDATCSIATRTTSGQGLDFCLGLPRGPYRWAEDRNTNTDLPFYTRTSGRLALPHYSFVHIIDEPDALSSSDPAEPKYVWHEARGGRETFESFEVVLKNQALNENEAVRVIAQIASKGDDNNQLGGPSFFTTRGDQFASVDSNTLPVGAREAYTLCAMGQNTQCRVEGVVKASLQKLSSTDASERPKLVISWPCPSQSMKHEIFKGRGDRDEKCVLPYTRSQNQQLGLANQPIVGYRVEVCECTQNTCNNECASSSRRWQVLEHNGDEVHNIFDKKYWSPRSIDDMGVYVGTVNDHQAYFQRHASTRVPAENVRSPSGRWVAVVRPFDVAVGKQYFYRVSALNAAGVYSSPMRAANVAAGGSTGTPPPSPPPPAPATLPDDALYLGFKRADNDTITCYEADFNADGTRKSSSPSNRLAACKLTMQLKNANGVLTSFNQALKLKITWPALQVGTCDWSQVGRPGYVSDAEFSENQGFTRCASALDVADRLKNALVRGGHTWLRNAKQGYRAVWNPNFAAGQSEVEIPIAIIKNDTRWEQDELTAFQLIPHRAAANNRAAFEARYRDASKWPTLIVEGGANAAGAQRVFLNPENHRTRTSPTIKIIDDDYKIRAIKNSANTIWVEWKGTNESASAYRLETCYATKGQARNTRCAARSSNWQQVQNNNSLSGLSCSFRNLNSSGSSPYRWRCAAAGFTSNKDHWFRFCTNPSGCATHSSTQYTPYAIEL